MSYPRYSPTGHLIYGVNGTLRAVGFDLDRLEVTDPNPVPVLAGVVTKPGGAADFDLASDGSLVYVTGQGAWDQLTEEQKGQDSKPRSRSGRKGKPDRFYAELARDYASLVAANDPRPVLTLAKRRGSSVSLLRSAIKRARDRDLLTKAHPGQGHGDLTPKGRRVLRQKRKPRKKAKRPPQ